MTTLLDKTFLGIEFRDDSVVVAFLRNSPSGISLVSSETFQMKEGRDTSGQVKDLISAQGADISRVFVSIPDKWAITKYTEIPSVKGRSKSAIVNMMKFEVERHIPFPIENVSYDFLVLKQKESFFSTVLVSVLNEKVDRVNDFLEKLGLAPHSITLSSFAVLSAMESSGVPAGGIQEVLGITRRSDVFATRGVPGVSVYINGSNTTLSLVSDGLCIHQRTFRFDPGTDSADKIVQMLSEIMDKLGVERLENLLVSGDESSAKGVAEGIKGLISLDDITVSEVSEFHGDIKGSPMDGNAAAIGACFAGLGIGTNRINILPHKREYEMKKVAPLATKAFLVLAVLMLIGMFVASAVKQKNYLAGLEAALAENEPAVKELEEVISTIKTFKEQRGVLDSVKRNEIALEVLAELTAVLPRDAWLTNLHYKGIDIKGKRTDGELVISGYAASSSILIPLLEDSDYLAKVEFVGPIKKKGLKEQFKIKADIVNIPAGEGE